MSIVGSGCRISGCPWTYIIVLVVAISGHSHAAEAGRSLRHDDDIIAESNRCGPNSLVLFLDLCGAREPNAHAVGLAAAPRDGTSMLEIRNAAVSCGIDAVVRRYLVEEAGELALPAIVQLRGSQNTLVENHYAVAYKISPERLYLIDGTTGRRSSIPLNRLSEFWTGYALVPERAAISSFGVHDGYRCFSLACIEAAALGFLVTWFRRFPRGTASATAGDSFSTSKSRLRLKWFFLTFALCLPLPSTAGAADDDLGFKPWRSPANGGLNALFCCLRVYGRDISYTELLDRTEAGPPVDSLLQLSRVSSDFGLKMKPVSMTFEELSRCRLPVITHIDGESPEMGSFLLVFQITDERIGYVNGSTASVHQIPHENFLRVWSGFALAPPESRDREIAATLGGLILGAMVAIVSRSQRFRFKRVAHLSNPSVRPR